MNGIHHLHIRMQFHDSGHGIHDIFHGLAIVLPAMAGQHNDSVFLKIQLIEQLRGESKILAHCIAHGVNRCISGNKNITRYAFPAQIICIGSGRRKMKLRNIAD